MSGGSVPSQAEHDFYIVTHVATTCDEHGVYVTKDSAEVIEIGWLLLDAKNLEEVHRETVLVKPVNTPITPLCTSLTTLTWEHVRAAGTFRDAMTRFDAFVSETLKDKEFSFVTLDSWDLRVQLPREARDKAVVLPAYLQHSRVFDLRAEYQRWQQYHPESLPFGPSSLANICAALEVEPVHGSAPIKHNLPFHLQALAPASPRRALEEAITLARVLRGLVEKSQPTHEHSDVLTTPLDAGADVRAFLAERSKVLHLSGLPHDTTQSELESWFTQFGGRPIAFWTLKTPDQHKPTGSGFAVFSSHEEAAESLCMNGRALNEKAIEVSPSSNRVLDRAADILTPFPPSKNRPRPGDWTCPSCGFSNFQRRTACFRCSFPAGSNMHGADSFPYTGFGYGPPAMMPQHHMGHQANYNMGHGRGGGGGMVPFRAGDWKCGSEGCGYHNFAKNVTCLRCGASRASAAVVADSAYSNNQDHSSGYTMPSHPLPGQGPFSGPSNAYNSGGFGAQQFGGQPSQYPTMSPVSNPFPPTNSAFGQSVSGGAFDSRAAEAAFSSVGGPSSGHSIFNGNGHHAAPYESQQNNNNSDPFAFLSPGMKDISLDDENRRNGAKSPG